MSREILFRIKDGNNKWVYGFPLVYDDGNCAFVDINPLNELKPTEMCEIHSVYNDTLGQFTGLTDKNGTKIFEGDIVNSTHPLADTNDDGELIPFVIKYTDEDVGSCGCCYPCFTGVGFVGESVNGTRVSGEVKVVGNIWDNPELLKED